MEQSWCKKRKRGERVFRFKTFGENGYPIEFDGDFRENVKALVFEFGNYETNNIKMPTWSFELEVNRHPPFHVMLFVVEESVEASTQPHCRHCLLAGWGDHLICNKKYHFVMTSKDTSAAILNFDYNYEGKKGKLNLLELQGHIMYGVFHSNGFGHLLYVNGVETGSNLPGQFIMDFWDRLCASLKARKVSLSDVSLKRNMELRLLHGIAYGLPWFGRWGYEFGRGSHGVTQQIYKTAVETIQSMPSCVLLHNLNNICNRDVTIIFSKYQALSGQSLPTLGDLFRFMFEFRSHLPEDYCVYPYNAAGISAEPACRWSLKRIKMATRVIVEALKRAECRWVSRQEVRDAARVYIGDTGLLDFVLKSLGNHIVGNYLVRRSLNPVTKVLEYCLEEVPNAFPDRDGLAISKVPYKMTKSQVMKDLFYLYRYILNGQTQAVIDNNGILNAIREAVRILLDAKNFVKEYNGDDRPSGVDHHVIGLEEKLKLRCTVMVMAPKEEMPPFECITVKRGATFDELKEEVESSFRELYLGLRNLVVESVVNMKHVSGTESVTGLIEVGKKLVFQGTNRDANNINLEFFYENGLIRNRVVDCSCGAEEDDGERMISCDICEVWQHSRCVGIPNHQEIPCIFLCSRCEHEIMILPSFLS